MVVDDLFSEDLPGEARDLIQRAEGEIREIEASAAAQIEDVQRRAQMEIDALRERTDAATRQLRRGLLEELKPLQDSYAREGRLDEALAIRARVRQLRVGAARVEPDPGDLTRYGLEHVGKSFVFDVVGDATGVIWEGSEVYTSDSRLATAAVHAGAVAAGERGLVRATIVDAAEVTFTGSLRNGVQSRPWGAYRVGYRVTRATSSL